MSFRPAGEIPETIVEARCLAGRDRNLALCLSNFVSIVTLGRFLMKKPLVKKPLRVRVGKKRLETCSELVEWMTY